MNVNRLYHWNESPQMQSDLRQPQLIHYGKQGQTGDLQALHPDNPNIHGDGLVTLYDSLPCICFTLNTRKIILSASQFAAACLAYDALELAQKPVSDMFYWEDQASCQAQLTEVQQRTNQIPQWDA